MKEQPKAQSKVSNTMSLQLKIVPNNIEDFEESETEDMIHIGVQITYFQEDLATGARTTVDMERVKKV